MRDVTIPVLDAPVEGDAGWRGVDPELLAVLHRDVLETIRLTIEGSAHPSCACCHELAAALDRYLVG
jgi:hypothetical protein